ncbi:MAG TPA: inosine/xanthosine triphosphatase [Anaerolineae bacterium]|nr:inosine/xanthosine triphosphatase [Anaerolineae bacterium]
MKIAVGSTNPVKIAAVHSVVERVWPEAEVASLAVPSGVSAMPMSDADCLAGARYRARAVQAATGATLGLGLEGGVNPESAGLMLLGWVAVVDEDGREGVGGGARLPLPSSIAERVLAGAELGPVMDALMGQQNVKQKGGAVGALTAGLVLRQETFAVAVAYALAPFVSPDFYGPWTPSVGLGE